MPVSAEIDGGVKLARVKKTPENTAETTYQKGERRLAVRAIALEGERPPQTKRRRPAGLNGLQLEIGEANPLPSRPQRRLPSFTNGRAALSPTRTSRLFPFRSPRVSEGGCSGIRACDASAAPHRCTTRSLDLKGEPTWRGRSFALPAATRSAHAAYCGGRSLNSSLRPNR